MHIMHLVTRLLRAGSEENTLSTCLWQAAAGHRVTLLHGRGADPWWYDNPPPGVDLIEVPNLVHRLDPGADLAALSALRSIFRQMRPDVIHTHQSKAGILGRLASSAWPRAVTVHGIHIVPFFAVGRTKRMMMITAEKLAARRTDVFIGVSNAVGQAYIDAGIARRGRVHCVRSGFDVQRFRNARPPADQDSLIQVPGSHPSPGIVLMLAAFEARKRHDAVLRAFARAAGELPELRLLLAGSGPEEQRIRQTVALLGLGDKVVFCGHRSDPESLLAMADLSILASNREGLPRVAVQSIAAGCPVVLTELPGIDEIVTDGRNGCVVGRNDLDGLWKSVGHLLRHRPALHRLQDGTRRTDVTAWDVSLMGQRTTALYGLPLPVGQSGQVAA